MTMAGYLLGEIPWIREHVDLIAIGIVVLSITPVLISFMRRKK
jgi:membrane-associated protein